MRILVVDDDTVMRNILSVMLERADFEVDLAEDGRIGVEKWEESDYDLVLMDVQMPGMNGFEATPSSGRRSGRAAGTLPSSPLQPTLSRKMKRNALPRAWMLICPNR